MSLFMVTDTVFISCHQNKKLLFALVCETLKYSTVLTQILEATKIEKYEKTLRDRSLTLVLLYDFLIGKGINGANKLKVSYPSTNIERTVRRHFENDLWGGSYCTTF